MGLRHQPPHPPPGIKERPTEAPTEAHAPEIELQYRWLGVYWNRAREKAKCPTLRMYDLRHLSAQYAGDRGVTDRDLTVHLGHADPKMSHVYSRRGIARGIAKVIADVLEEGQAQKG